MLMSQAFRKRQSAYYKRLSKQQATPWPVCKIEQQRDYGYVMVNLEAGDT
jgi:hypothetical protein